MSRPERKKWATGSELVRQFQHRTAIQPEKVSILSAVWERELGHFAKHWSLVGVRRGVLYVKPRSAAAAQELQLRSGDIVRALNKYFSGNWIKSVRSSL